MKFITLTKGKQAIVDDKDFESVSQFKWCASKSRHNWYALRRIKGTGQPGKKQKLHQFILGVPYADHINGDGLDCRRDNLRPSTVSQNARNRGKQRNNTTGYKGVSHWCDGRFQAAIKLHGKRYPLGLFDTAKEAALAYDAAVPRFHGEFGRLNFPRT